MTAPSRFAIVSGMAAAFTGPCPCRNKRNALVAILITVLMPMVRGVRGAHACEGSARCCGRKEGGGVWMRQPPCSLRTRIRELLRHTMTCVGGSR